MRWPMVFGTPSGVASPLGFCAAQPVGKARDIARSVFSRRIEGGGMTRILLVGYDPETVDFSDPSLPPGMTAEKARAGIAVAAPTCGPRSACACVVR
jgi:hypothetical protein